MPACVTAQAARFKIGVWARKEKTRAFAGGVMSLAFSDGKVATT